MAGPVVIDLSEFHGWQMLEWARVHGFGLLWWGVGGLIRVLGCGCGKRKGGRGSRNMGGG